MVDRDVVELEAKGQASAQSTTGTVTLGANKKKEKNKKIWMMWMIIINLDNLDNLDNLRLIWVAG